MAFIAFIGAVAFGTPFLLLAAIGIAALGIGMLVLAAALFLVKTEDLQALGQAMEGMGRAAEAGGAPLEQMIDFLDHLEDVADDIDEDGLEGIASVFRNIANIELPEGGAGGIIGMLEFIGGNAGIVGTINGLSSAIRELSSAMSELGFDALISSVGMASLFDSMGGLSDLEVTAVQAIQATTTMMEKVSTLDSTAVDQAEDLLEQATEFMESASGATEAGSLSGILEKLTSGLTGGSSKGKGGSQTPIVLSMDASGRKVIAKGIIDDLMPEINRKLDPRVS